MEKRWKEGDVENGYPSNKFSCPDMIQNGQRIHQSYFQCNPYYLLCHLKGQTGAALPEKFELVKSSFKRRGNLGVTVKHTSSKKTASLVFKNTCRNILLPHSVYAAGPLENSPYLWDNVGQEHYLDKHYVTNGEIHAWKKSVGKESSFSAKDFHKPSLELNLEDKKRYCEYRGGQLLQSRQLDAASFLPSQVENNGSWYIYKFPYPWTKNKDALRRKSDRDCNKIFSKECLQDGYEYHSTYSPSWAGVYHSLGSHVESMENKFYPPANLKMSSIQFPLSSQWHKLGLRGSTQLTADLEGYNGADLDTPATEIRSAFRCAHYR